MKHPRIGYIISLLASSGILAAAAGFNVNTITPQPLFTDLDQFVLVAEEIHLAGGVQVSSGDLASNSRIFISGENIVNGNLFSDEIRIASSAVINGSVSFNKLHLADTAEVLGEESTPISLPVIQLPNLPEVQPNGNDVIVENKETLNPGNFNRIEVKKGAKLTLVPGVYNLNELILRDSSRLIYSDTTTVNIRQNLKVQNKVLIAPNNTNLEPTALTINFSPESKSQGKNKEPKVVGSNVITIGEESFLSFKLVAPKSKVVFGGKITFRGQVIAKEIQVGEGGALSKELTGAKIALPEDIIEDPDGGVYPLSELLVLLTPDATPEDALVVANEINGRIVGVVQSINLYQIEIPVATIEDLESLIIILRGRTDLKVDGVFRDFLVPID